MKRTLILVAVVTIALLFSTTAMAQEACSEVEQAFTIPDSFPLDGDDWTIVQFHSTAAEAFDEDGASVTGTSVGAEPAGAEWIIHFPVPVTIDRVKFDVTALDNAGGVFVISYSGCDVVEGAITGCDDADVIASGTDDEPFAFDQGDLAYENVSWMGVSLQMSGTDVSMTMDNLLIEAVISACLYRPVSEADIIAESDSDNDDQWAITTNADAPIYAISDALVVNVSHTLDGYGVTLLINGVDAVHYLQLSATFAEPGTMITGGCILGYAGDPPPGALDHLGLIQYVHDPDLGDWHDYNESIGAAPCNADLGNCINANPHFNDNGVGWTSRYALASSLNNEDDSMMRLPPDGQLYQPGFPVDVSDTWYVTVVVAVQSPATHGSLDVRLAGVNSTLLVNTFGNEFVTLTTPAISPAFTGTSELQLYNTYAGNTTLRITYACLHEGDVVIAPPACYFADAALSTDSFETEGGATYEPGGILSTGTYIMPPDSVIRGPVNISAFSDADTDFTLKISGSAPEGASTLAASIVDSDTDDELAAIGEYDYLAIFWATISNTFTIDDGENLNGDLYIVNTGDEPIRVGSLCLSSDTGVWPGYENPDYVSTSLLPSDCTECHFPASLVDVVAWLNWIGCVLRYLIFCLLYTLVNNIWGTIIAIVSGIGLFGRWLGQALVIVAMWAWQVAGRLVASLVSTLIPIINFVLAWLFSQPFFQGILDAVAIVGLWLAAVWSFVLLMAQFLATVFNYGIAILNIIADAYVTFYTALSSPASFSLFPDCTDTGDPLYDVCLGFDIMAFIFDQLPMALVFMGLLAALIMIAQFGRMLDLIGELSENL